MSRTITMGRHLRKCRKERQQLKEENAALKQKMFEMTSFSRGRIAELSRAGDGKSKPASHYTADAVLKDLGLLGAQKQGDLGLGAQKQGGRRKTRKKKRSRKKKRRRKRRKTRRKKGAFDPISDFKKSVDKTEIKKQADLFNKMKRARIEGNTEKQEELRRHMKKSFDRMIYWKTPEAQANAARIINNKVEQAMPEINKSIRRGLLRPQKQPKTGRNPKQHQIGGKRRRKTKRRKR